MRALPNITTMKARLILCITFLSLLVVLAMTGCTTSAKHEGYTSTDDAVASLIKAVRSGSKEDLVKVLGPGADEIVYSGDPVADDQRIQTFLAAYDKHHEFATQPDGDVTLLVGDDNWPFPIPLVRREDGWVFDVSQGKEEILARRIGRNEIEAMTTCMAVVDAQHDYAALDVGATGLHEYAQKFFSAEGKKDGLYWKVSDSETPSPLGPLVAEAADEGYTAPAKSGTHVPYHGYFYRILKAQGSSAPGGARDYVVGGKMVGGFAVLAYPAQYGNSGIMTFMANYDGILYQADLGDDTAAAAPKITAYNPGPEWHITKIDEPATQKTKP